MNTAITHNKITICINDQKQWVFEDDGSLVSFSTLEEAQQAIDTKRDFYPTQAFRDGKRHFWVICAIDGKFQRVYVTGNLYREISAEQESQ